MIQTLTDRFFNLNIFLNPDYEIECGWDQACVSYPVVFPTVKIEFEGGSGLCHIVDRLRVEEGTLPVVLPKDYYRFFVGLNDFTDSKVDTLIIARVVDSEAADYGWEYAIDLSEEEQKALYRRLDEGSKTVYGKSCEELLEEARKRMEEEAE